jgi:hypothetical protein
MTISHSESIELTCPACGTGLAADAWTLVDAAERPDLAQALRDGALNMAACPSCGAAVAADAPLLFHDPATRRVYFAVPPGADEYAWREQAKELLYALAAALPDADHRPYLGDIQVEQEVEGVRRSILRRERGRGSPGKRAGDREPAGATADEQTTSQRDARRPRHAATPLPPEPVPLFGAVHALLAANTTAEFDAIVEQHPLLLSAAGDAAARQAAEQAFAQGERDVAAALREVRLTLARLRSGGVRELPEPPAGDESSPIPHDDGGRGVAGVLSDAAYQALLHVASRDQLLGATRDYPALLEAPADAILATRSDMALDEGNERLARTIETQREALAELRAVLGTQEALRDASRALIAAGGEAEVADVIAAHPILLTDAAQDALAELASGARAQGDVALAEYAISCREMLRTVRAGLEDS